MQEDQSHGPGMGRPLPEYIGMIAVEGLPGQIPRIFVAAVYALRGAHRAAREEAPLILQQHGPHGRGRQGQERRRGEREPQRFHKRFSFQKPSRPSHRRTESSASGTSVRYTSYAGPATRAPGSAAAIRSAVPVRPLPPCVTKGMMVFPERS